MDDDLPSHWRQSAALKFVAFLLLALSPVGAPALGLLLIEACDIPWEGPVQCAVPAPVLHYFLSFTILPFVWTPLFVAILWLMSALAVLLACIWYAGVAVWQAACRLPAFAERA
jgi:hypothetical protein